MPLLGGVVGALGLVLSLARCTAHGASMTAPAGVDASASDASTDHAPPGQVLPETGLGSDGSRGDGSTAVDAQAAESGLSSSFFGMDINRVPAVWPDVPFGMLRLWDAGVAWVDMEPSGPTPTFTTLDAWLDLAMAHHFDVLYTFGRTPPWAQTKGDASTCTSSTTPGGCLPPSDLNSDGSGTDAMFKAFVTAVVAHAGPRVAAYEIWNEFNNTGFWVGTAAQLVRMAQDARTIVKAMQPSAIVLTPSACNCNNTSITAGTKKTTDPQDGMAFYLETSMGGVTGASLADAIAFHPYLGPRPPEGIVGLITAMKGVVGGVPLWDTESSWGTNNSVTGCPAMPPFDATCASSMAAFAARSIVLTASSGVVRMVWYAGDSTTWGSLWTASSGTPYPAGNAYLTIRGWLEGTTGLTCTESMNPVWTCTLSRGGAHEVIAWAASGTGNVDAAGFTTYTTLDGTMQSVTSATVPVAAAPILLQP